MVRKIAKESAATIIQTQQTESVRREPRASAPPVQAVAPIVSEPVLPSRDVGVSPPSTASRPRSTSKINIVLGMLETCEGASLAELVAVTGRLPHPTRAALTGLRKRGFDVVSEKHSGESGAVSRYSIRPAVAA